MKIEKMKIVTALVMVLILSCSFVLPTFAAQAPGAEIEPLWVGISTMSLTLSFPDAGVGTATGTARKMSAAQSISAVLTIYQQDGANWIYITEWSGSKTIGTLGLGGDFAAVRGRTYKAVFTVTAMVNGVAETETFEDVKTYT